MVKKIGYKKPMTKKEKKLRGAIRTNPRDADAHVELAILLENSKQYNEAVKEYKKAILINPKDGNIRYDLGGLLERLGHEKEALKEYKLYEKYKRGR